MSQKPKSQNLLLDQTQKIIFVCILSLAAIYLTSSIEIAISIALLLLVFLLHLSPFFLFAFSIFFMGLHLLKSFLYIQIQALPYLPISAVILFLTGLLLYFLGHGKTMWGVKISDKYEINQKILLKIAIVSFFIFFLYAGDNPYKSVISGYVLFCLFFRKNDGRFAFGIALFFLTLCPFLLAFKIEASAEISAVFAYYFLCIGVIQEILEMGNIGGKIRKIISEKNIFKDILKFKLTDFVFTPKDITKGALLFKNRIFEKPAVKGDVRNFNWAGFSFQKGKSVKGKTAKKSKKETNLPVSPITAKFAASFFKKLIFQVVIYMSVTFIAGMGIYFLLTFAPRLLIGKPGNPSVKSNAGFLPLTKDKPYVFIPAHPISNPNFDNLMQKYEFVLKNLEIDATFLAENSRTKDLPFFTPLFEKADQEEIAASGSAQIFAQHIPLHLFAKIQGNLLTIYTSSKYKFAVNKSQVPVGQDREKIVFTSAITNDLFFAKYGENVIPLLKNKATYLGSFHKSQPIELYAALPKTPGKLVLLRKLEVAYLLNDVRKEITLSGQNSFTLESENIADSPGDKPGFYLFLPQEEKMVQNPEISFVQENPKEIQIKVRKAADRFILALNKEYDAKWHLVLGKKSFFSKLPFSGQSETSNLENTHFILNSAINGWWLETKPLCQNNPNCLKGDDGLYTLNMVITYGDDTVGFLWIIPVSIVVLIGIGLNGRKVFSKSAKFPGLPFPDNGKNSSSSHNFFRGLPKIKIRQAKMIL